MLYFDGFSYWSFRFTHRSIKELLFAKVHVLVFAFTPATWD